MSNKQQNKKERKEIKKIENVIRTRTKKGGLRNPKNKDTASHIASEGAHTPKQGMDSFMRQAFSRKEASRYMWGMCVTNPWTAQCSPIPMSITPGASASCPRMYPVTLRGVAIANASGFFHIGANADGWVQKYNNAGLASIEAFPIPDIGKMYLGYPSSLGVGYSRGAPVHATQQSWAGDTAGPVGANGFSSPNSQTFAASATIVAGSFVAAKFPDTFIPQADPTDAGSGERFTQVALGLRVRPLAPLLTTAGRMTMFQQTLGDNEANTFSTSNGAIDTFASLSAIPKEQLNRHEVAVANWPPEKWLTASAIPNTTVCFGQWKGNTGDGSRQAGHPMLSVLGEGVTTGTRFEYEARYVYAYYGILSYEQNAQEVARQVSAGAEAIQEFVELAPAHMKPLVIPADHHSMGKQASHIMAQSAVDNGKATSKSVGSYIADGVKVVEAITGESVSDVIGEVLLSGLALLM